MKKLELCNKLWELLGMALQDMEELDRKYYFPLGHKWV